MKACVDKDVCIGCGLCAETCPRVFEMKDNIAIVKVNIVDPSDEESCHGAAEACPVNAISIT